MKPGRMSYDPTAKPQQPAQQASGETVNIPHAPLERIATAFEQMANSVEQACALIVAEVTRDREMRTSSAFDQTMAAARPFAGPEEVKPVSG